MGLPELPFQPPSPEAAGFLELESSSSKSSATEEEEQLLVVPLIADEFYSSVIKEIVHRTSHGLQRHNPRLAKDGMGGTYFMPDASDGDRYVAVFKPVDEEPYAVNNPKGYTKPPGEEGVGAKIGTTIGGGAIREVAAYLLDHPLRGPPHNPHDIGFAGVAPTVMVRCRLHNDFNHGGGEETEKMKVGSLQMYNPNVGNCEDMGTSGLPVYDLHKISQLDIRLSNTDRNLGNILRSPEGRLLPIDHGYCLPNKYGDVTFEWLYWGQAKLPYGSDVVEYINSLDAEIDIQLLKHYGWDIPHGCARTLRISTMLLKKGAKRGLSPFDLGSILSRKGCNTLSLIEKIIQEAEVASEVSFLKTVSSIMDRHLASSFGDLQPWKGEPGEEKLGGINRSAMEASLEDELCETRLTLVKETDQSKAKDLQIADLNMELNHERDIKRQAEVQIKAKDLEIAMLTQERVKKSKRDWWLWGTVATALTIGAASLAYSNPSGSTYQVDD